MNLNEIMGKEYKKQWILKYIMDHNGFVDVFTDDFVSTYIEGFDPKVEYYSYGTPKVPELSKLLSELHKENKLHRRRHYCEIWRDGYPKWFYIYYV